MTAELPAGFAEDLLARLPASADAYPQNLDLVRQTILLVRFDAAAYRAASFLDDRILNPATQGAWVPFHRVADGAERIVNGRPLHFVFHTGHVGSTLVSRLLDETGQVLSLREPLPLRTLADAHDCVGRPDSLLGEAQFDAVLTTFTKLWSRGYDTTRSVIVKATSSAGRMAVPLMIRDARARAIYLNLRAEPYLATLLAGQNSPIDLRGQGPERVRRLQDRLAEPLTPLHAMSIGELAAMSWLAESWTERETIGRFADRVLPLDFDDFLAHVADRMGRIVGHFGLAGDARYLSQVDRSPVLTRYSKAPEYAYTPAVRAEVLRDSRRDNREEIRKGMQWLERIARAETAARRVIDEIAS